MLESLVLSVTYRCPIKCNYCGAECSPDNTERLSIAEIESFINQVYSFGKLRLVVFTGGEPFLLGNDLLHSVEYCSKKGLTTRIVTNAFWARNRKLAEKMIKKCVDAGLSEINLSCDDYHQEFIPLDYVKYANEACSKYKLPCLIGHKVMKGCKITLEYLDEYFGYPLSRFDSQKMNPDNNVISSGYTVPVARNMHMISDIDILYPDSEHHWMGPCTSIFKHVIITPLKELSICCGMIPRNVPEIFFGPINDKTTLNELIVLAHNDLIVNWLALEGPYGMMKFILRKDPKIKFRKKYVNNCHLCSEILSRKECREIISEYGHEKSFEIYLERSLYDCLRTSPEIFLDHLVPGK
jgi:hypothetical protein